MTSSSWRCENTKCICEPGTFMCGGTTIDISSVVNSASGKIVVKCENTTSCTLDMEFISSLFPKGLSLNNCVYGECVDQFATPVNTAQSLVSG